MSALIRGTFDCNNGPTWRCIHELGEVIAIISAILTGSINLSVFIPSGVEAAAN